MPAPPERRYHGGMTAQVHDRLRHRGLELEIVGGDEPWSPLGTGLAPTTLHTACWRGYHYTIEIVEGRLRLADVHLGLKPEEVACHADQGGPRLYGRPPTRHEAGIEHVWVGLAEPLGFTGTILAATGFIPSLYEHMGWQAAWKFETVLELRLEDGALVAETDRSAAMAELRARGGEPMAPPPFP